MGPSPPDPCPFFVHAFSSSHWSAAGLWGEASAASRKGCSIRQPKFTAAQVLTAAKSKGTHHSSHTTHLTLSAHHSSHTTHLTLITHYSSYTHHTPLITHYSSYTHQTPLITHHSSHTTHLTPLITHHSSHTTQHTPLISHHSSHTTHLIHFDRPVSFRPLSYQSLLAFL